MIIYKITNNINNKIYIGKRIWSKDKFLKTNYFGSGKYIKNAVNKYGNTNEPRPENEQDTDLLVNIDDLLASCLNNKQLIKNKE